MARAPLLLNLGCGFQKLAGWVNCDAYPDCKPDLVHDMEVLPWPWETGTVDHILAAHVFEHLDEWWGPFCEAARVLRVGGKLDIRVPDESSSTALGWRDHRHLFTLASFHGTVGRRHGTSSWGAAEADTVPLRLVDYKQVPYPQFLWMVRWPFKYALLFAARHMRNFIHEQRFLFEKVAA